MLTRRSWRKFKSVVARCRKKSQANSLKKVSDALDSHFQQMCLQQCDQMESMGNTPPPPPPPPDGNDAGFTKDELNSQLNEIGSSDSKRSNLISSIVNNFDKADADGDVKVSFKEAMAYDKANQSNSSSTASSSVDKSSESQTMKKLMQLVRAYGIFGQNENQSNDSAVSVSA